MRMRARAILLGPAAFGLLAGVIGLGVSAYCLGSSHRDDINSGRVGLVAAAALLATGGLCLLAAFSRCAQRKRLATAFVRWALVAGVMAVPSAVLFGPTGGFHHHIGFGPVPFFYMVWNGEDPAPNSFQIVDGYEVWFDPLRFGILLGVWTTIAVIVVGVVRPVRAEDGFTGTRG